MQHRFLGFTVAGESSQKMLVAPRKKKLLESASSGGDDVMSGTQYTEDDEDKGSDSDPLQVSDPAKEVGGEGRYPSPNQRERKSKGGLDRFPRQNSAKLFSGK